jgi:hypothetical protein
VRFYAFAVRYARTAKHCSPVVTCVILFLHRINCLWPISRGVF